MGEKKRFIFTIHEKAPSAATTSFPFSLMRLIKRKAKHVQFLTKAIFLALSLQLCFTLHYKSLSLCVNKLGGCSSAS